MEPSLQPYARIGFSGRKYKLEKLRVWIIKNGIKQNFPDLWKEKYEKLSEKRKSIVKGNLREEDIINSKNIDVVFVNLLNYLEKPKEIDFDIPDLITTARNFIKIDFTALITAWKGTDPEAKKREWEKVTQICPSLECFIVTFFMEQKISDLKLNSEESQEWRLHNGAKEFHKIKRRIKKQDPTLIENMISLIHI